MENRSSNTKNDETQTFSGFMEAKLGCSTEAIADGQFHRFDDPDKQGGNRSCYAMLRPTADFGVCGNWGTGEKYHWYYEGTEEISFNEVFKLQHRIEAMYRDRADQRALYQDDAADQARSMIAKSSYPQADHPYLKKKNIGVANSRQYGERLLIPIMNVRGELRNIQQIYPDGTKHFLKGGEVTGNFSLIGAESLPTAGKLFVCEGWATGVTLHQQHSVPVAAAMSAGKLYEACKKLRPVLPEEVHIIAAADDDRNIPGNPGLAMAYVAQAVVGVEVIRPDFPCNDCACSDFNDLAACPEAAKVGNTPPQVQQPKGQDSEGAA